MSAVINNGGPPNPYTNNSGLQPADVMPDVQSPLAAAAGTSGASNAYSGLVTPDSLMAYCEARLNNLNSQMETIFQQQTTGTNFINDVDNAVDAFNVYSNGINEGGSSIDVAPADFAKLNATLTTLQSEAPPGSSAAAAIQDAIAILNQGPNGHGTDTSVSPTDVASIVKDLQGIATDENSSSQLQMINLQSLMSQQQTAVQLTTNLMQALDQQAQSIATNVGK